MLGFFQGCVRGLPRSISWALVACTPALAQTPEDLEKELLDLLNTKVTVASKTAESFNAAPGVITVVSRMEMEGFGGKNLGEVLSRVVGMQWLSPDIFPGQSVVIRGQETTPYNNHVLVLLDGRPMRDPITGGLNGTFWNAFPLSVIERLEIIRGPGSVLYGSCAYSGVINIVTRSRETTGSGGQVSVGGGSDGGFGLGAQMAFREGELSGIAGLMSFENQGPTYSFVDYEGTYGSDRFFQTSQGAMARLALHDFTFSAFVANYDPYTLEGGNEIWYPNTKSQQITTHLDLGYATNLGATTRLSANLTYNQTDWWIGERYVTPTPEYPRMQTGGKALLGEAMVSFRPTEGLNVILGGGGERATWGEGLVVDGDQTSTFLYLQADYKIASLKLIAGAQYNKIQDIDGEVSPRAGLIYDFTPQLGAKVLYSTAFRKGYPNETGFNHPIFRGNAQLQPEMIDTMEAQVFYQGKAAQGSLTYFQSRMKDIITRKLFPLTTPPPGLPPFYFQYLNGGTWDFQGLELEGRVSLASGWLLTGSASYQTNEKPATEGQAAITDAALHPNTQVKLGILYQGGGWSASLFDTYWSEPKPTTLVRPGSAVVNPVPEATHMVSAKVSWKPFDQGTRSFKIALEGQNLLDKDVRYPDYPNKAVNSLIPLSAGATFLASCTVTF